MGLDEQGIVADKIRVEIRDDVAVLSIANPPMGTLTAEVRSKLLKEFDKAIANSSVRGVVIAGTGDVFASGASATEAEASSSVDLGTLCDRIEAAPKPVIAAISGSALGGGLELALAAHRRVARASARLGSPEITVGLVPGAGGTQRLPKVVGGVAALKMLLSGRAVSGENAQKLGLVDTLSTGDPVDDAVASVRALSDSMADLQRSSTRRDRLGEGTSFLEAVAVHRKVAAQSPLEAPMRMIECVEAALLLPYDIGRGLEQAAFEDLVQSEHSRSLRHVFAAERQLQAATRWEGRVPSRPLKSVAIVGAQALGAELVVQCLDAGFSVIVAEDSDEMLETGVTRIIEHFDARVAASSMTEEAVEQTLDRMQAVSGYRTLIDADIVIDPMPSTTRARVAELDASMRAGAVLALGASDIEIGTIAAGTGRVADVVGMRFSHGMRKNRLVEFTVTEATGPKSVATARALARKLDRLILDTDPSPTGIGDKLTEALHAAADLCLEDGARITQIDNALRDWGIPFGSFTLRDILGLSRPGGPKGMQGERGGGLDEALIGSGRVGLSVGRGYYIYRERGKAGIEDQVVAALAEADRVAKNIRPQTLTDGEIRKRCLSAMAGVGAQLLADNVARRPADIDMVAVHALGFARRTGGIMFAADLLGLADVRQRLLQMSQVSRRIAPPASIFEDLIRSEKTFSDLNG